VDDDLPLRYSFYFSVGSSATAYPIQALSFRSLVNTYLPQGDSAGSITCIVNIVDEKGAYATLNASATVTLQLPVDLSAFRSTITKSLAQAGSNANARVSVRVSQDHTTHLTPHTRPYHTPHTTHTHTTYITPHTQTHHITSHHTTPHHLISVLLLDADSKCRIIHAQWIRMPGGRIHQLHGPAS
jgi:hypothetical protein